MKDITIGRYFDLNTPVNRLDARNKILLMILFMVSIFFQFKVWSTSLIFSGFLLVCLIIFMIIAKVSIVSLLKSFSSLWFLILILLIIYIFLPGSYKVPAFKIGNYQIYWDSFYLAGYILLRIMMFLAITLIITSTTKPMDMTSAFEWYLTPLKYIKFPTQAIAMTMAIALRFIPTILDESKRIMNAQASRGVDFEHGGLIKKFKSMFTLIIPLFVSALERSDELSNAMIAKNYDPNAKRTRYHKLSFHWGDLIALLIVGMIFALVLTCFIFNNTGDFNLIKILFGVTPIF